MAENEKKVVNLDAALEEAADKHFGKEDDDTSGDSGEGAEGGAGTVEDEAEVGEESVSGVVDGDGEGEDTDTSETDETDETVDEDAAAIEEAQKREAAGELSDEELAQLDQIGATPSQSLRLARLPKEARTEALAVMASKISGGEDSKSVDKGAGIKVNREDVVKSLRKDIPDAKITELSEKLNIDKDALKELVEVVQTATLDPAADTVVQLGEAIRQQQIHNQAQLVGVAVKSSRDNLGSKFPAVRKDEQWKKLVASPATAKLVSAYQEQGLDLYDAVQKALTDRCKSTFSESMTTKKGSTNPEEGEGNRKKVLKGTPAPGGRARYPTSKKKINFSKMPLNDALDKIFDAHEERRKTIKGK